jgi:hypothetical protein
MERFQHLVLLVVLLAGFRHLQAQSGLSIGNSKLRIHWEKNVSGWQIADLSVRQNGQWKQLENVSGEGTLIYSELAPGPDAVRTFEKSTGGAFPGKNYPWQNRDWNTLTNGVALNTAGNAIHYFFQSGKQVSKNRVQFQYEAEQATITSTFELDDRYPNDIVVNQQLRIKRDGYFSLATPTLVSVKEEELTWATVPGYFQGNAIQKDFIKAYAYGMGIPGLPVVYRERCASTLCPIISTKKGFTVSVIPEPGMDRDPWAIDTFTHKDWFIGLSHMNRKAELAPTLYYPVLGETKSFLKKEETISYSFRYSIIDGNWFKAIKHAVNDVYRFNESLALRQSKQSLTSRVLNMRHYVIDSATSLWRVEDFNGMQIGAQAYLGGVVGANRDAMKNADYGAMWYLAKATDDPFLKSKVIPYALNFKLAQQNDTGFFKGAVAGQYYLSKSKKFVEEWGKIVEPIGVTYYTMLDIGNILLFEPGNAQLNARLRMGAEFLMSKQKADGSWAVAYDDTTQQEIFKDIPDVRPTFYGLLVAYKILKEPRYLEAARKGADWILANSIATGSYLGVCGDARYVADFATAQTGQAMLDLFEVTQEPAYRDAAIIAAKTYVNSIYTHPVAGTDMKKVRGISREDWEISQSGLSFEHGGILGSANLHGPIQLCSHAGFFTRMSQITGESIFSDMARAGAIGRDAFVDSKTSVASYYWNAMNRGAGPYPHHAWWQIGWITDYLMAEAELRTRGNVIFPRGFVTPKVGPHQTYGFAPGKIYNNNCNLIIREGAVDVDHPAIDYILAQSENNERYYVVILNNRAQSTTFNLRFNPGKLDKVKGIRRIKSLSGNQDIKEGKMTIPSFGVNVMEISVN